MSCPFSNKISILLYFEKHFQIGYFACIALHISFVLRVGYVMFRLILLYGFRVKNSIKKMAFSEGRGENAIWSNDSLVTLKFKYNSNHCGKNDHQNRMKIFFLHDEVDDSRQNDCFIIEKI